MIWCTFENRITEKVIALLLELTHIDYLLVNMFAISNDFIILDEATYSRKEKNYASTIFSTILFKP